MKKIALDLDGVVFDSETLFRVYAEIYDVEKFKKNSLIDNSQIIYQKRYNWSDEENKQFYETFCHEILEKANIMPGVDIVLPKLSKDYEFIIVTARIDNELKKVRTFFKDIGFPNIKIYNNQKNKIDIFLKEKVNYIIDDDKDICLNASKESIYALYFKNSASSIIEENNYLKIVHNWGEIYKFLKLKDQKR